MEKRKTPLQEAIDNIELLKKFNPLTNEKEHAINDGINRSIEVLKMGLENEKEEFAIFHLMGANFGYGKQFVTKADRDFDFNRQFKNTFE